MVNNYWEKFYKEKKAPTKQSKFAESVESFFIDELKYKYRELALIDLGAGNGRDTKYLNISFKTFGVDKSYGKEVNKNSQKEDVNFGSVYKINTKEILNSLNFDIFYSRFFLHSISNEEIEQLIKISPNYFVAEFRIKGDKPVLYKNHKRNLIDLGWLINILLKNGFEILKLQAGRGMAKYKNEDPLVARVYAKKYAK